MSRLRIEHSTRYQYNKRVTLSYNEARMTPVTDPQQVVLESVLKVTPNHASVSSYRDYWGSRVTA
ncbi:transglutaminase, partial [Vibrio vulnificus]